METAVIDWWRNGYQSSTHKSLCLRRFCVVPREDPSTFGIQRSLEEQNCRCQIREKLQRLTESMESRLNSSGTSYQDSQRCSSVVKLMMYWATWDKHQKLSQEEFYLCRCSMTSLVTEKATKMKVWQMPKLSPYLQKKFGIGQRSFIGPGSEKKWYSMEENSPQGIWNHIAEKMLLEFAESGCPIFRATTPVSRGKLKKQRTRKTVDTLHCRLSNNWNYFSHIFLPISSVFTEQMQTCVKNLKLIKMDRGNLMYWWDNQLFTVKSRQKFVCRMTSRYIRMFYCNSMKNESSFFHKKAKWVNSVWTQDFWHVVEIGQYFMTKDTGDFRQFHTVACREYTLPRDDGSSQPRGWIKGNTKIGPVLEITTVVYMANMELRSEFGLWGKTSLNLGSEFLTDQTN